MSELPADPILKQYYKKAEDDVTERYSSILSIHLFRFFGLALMNLMGQLDRILTNAAVSIRGIGIEQNPMARLINLNPWIHMSGLLFVTIMWGALYLTTDKKNLLKFDFVLIFVLITYVMVLTNNILQLTGMIG